MNTESVADERRQRSGPSNVAAERERERTAAGRPSPSLGSHEFLRRLNPRFLRGLLSALVVISMCPAALAQVSVSPSTLDNGTVGVEYSQTFSAEGGSGYYAWGCEGTLPEGLSFNADTATLSGTPTVEASCSFTIQVLSFGESTWTPFSYDLNIYSPPPPPPLAISGSLTGGVTGGEYSQTLFASGGAGNYSWWIAAGSLPAELSLDFYTGMISGTPVSSGTSFFTVTVVDGDWNSVSADYQITVYDPPAISGSLPNGMANVAYSQTLGV